MLHRCIFVVFFLSHAQSVDIDQDLPSLVKRIDSQSTARINCQINTGSSIFIHWYVQKENQVIKRILYFKQGNEPNREAGFNKEKYIIESAPNNTNTLIINHLKDDDSGIYYCACWDTFDSHTDVKPQKGKLHSDYYKEFGPGTKLIITHTDQSVNRPDVTILASSKRDLKTRNSATLLCSLQNFFPDAIRVMWTVDGRSDGLKAEQGEIMTNPSSNLSSLYSWITINPSDIGKIYKCRYRHEGYGKEWTEVVYNTEHLKEELTLIKTCNSDDAGGKLMVFRTAQLIYALLILKSIMYCPLLLFFKYIAPE